jgi:hypothetical protein
MSPVLGQIFKRHFTIQSSQWPDAKIKKNQHENKILKANEPAFYV